MKNRKYILSSRYIEYEDACIELFNQMNDEGYILKSIGIFFVFEKSDKKVKYQIDYTTRDIEYNSIIEQQGYVYIGSCNDVHYYYNEDLNAIDLNTDLEVKKAILLNRYPIWLTLFMIVSLLLVIMGEINYLPKYLENPIMRYYNFNSFIYCIGLFMFMIPLICFLIYDFVKKSNAISNGTYNYHNFKKHSKISCIASVITYIVFIITAALTTTTWIDFIYAIDVVMITAIIRLFKNKFIDPNGSRDKRALLNILSFALMFIFITALSDLRVNQTPNIPDDFPTQSSLYRIEENIAIYELLAVTNYTEGNMADISMSTDYTECRTQKICTELFDRFIEINPNRKVDSKVVTECYEYLEQPNFYIFKFNTILVRFEERSPANVDTRILEFIEFYNKSKHF